MRSREYLKVTKAEEGRTKILALRNLRFIRDGKVMSHDDLELERADCLAITFEMQKKEDKNEERHGTPQGNTRPDNVPSPSRRRTRAPN